MLAYSGLGEMKANINANTCLRRFISFISLNYMGGEQKKKGNAQKLRILLGTWLGDELGNDLRSAASVAKIDAALKAAPTSGT